MMFRATQIPSKHHKVVRLRRRPVGMMVPGLDLVVSTEPTPELTDNKNDLDHHEDDGDDDDLVLLRRLYLSLDPAMRGWMDDIPSYIPPVQINDIMRGWTISQVVSTTTTTTTTSWQSTKSSQLKVPLQVGDIVLDNSMNGGWDEYAVVPSKKCSRIPTSTSTGNDVPLTAHLSVLGITGLTAYFGLLDVGKPKRGETILVSAAAGATGSVVCQIAKNVVGCKVVGIAGGPTKCQWLLNEVGCCDAVIDYKEAQGNPQKFQKQLKDSLRIVNSKGFDIFFDNVGGMILNESLRRLSPKKGRVVLCGAISSYNDDTTTSSRSGGGGRETNTTSSSSSSSSSNVSLDNYMALISLRAKIEGFIVTDYANRFHEAKQDMMKWISEGKLTYKEDVREGLENAPEYLNELFAGGNIGKLIVKVFKDEPRQNQKQQQQDKSFHPYSRL